MLMAQIVVAGLLVGLVALLFEAVVLASARRRVPVRILVTGTRGKSSVVRLIHRALLEDRIVALAKSTGSAARILLPNGEERPVRRRGRASILEQRGILLGAARRSSRFLVVEAMAIDPEVAQAEAESIIRPTHVVVTNARVDHLGPAGSSVTSVAEALACSVPASARAYVPACELAGEAGPALRATGADIIEVPPLTDRLVTDADLSRIDFPDNVSLAVRVCEDLGIPRAHVLHAAGTAPPDPGTFRIHHAESAGTVILNAFAANDPLSTQRILQTSVARHPELAERDIVVVLNVREDRADRTRLWVDHLPDWTATMLVVLGDRAQRVAVSRLLRARSDVPVLCPRLRRAADITEYLVKLRPHGLLLCVGNFAGIGKRLTEYWDEVFPSYG